MSKRTPGFKRMKGDYYRTPLHAIVPLLKHLPTQMTYCEPCAGADHLVRGLAMCGHAYPVASYDRFPRNNRITPLDAMNLTPVYLNDADFIITNPPWSRSLLHPMIEHFRSMRPTWLLFDADWMFTTQAVPYLRFCRKIVTVGRVNWIDGTEGVKSKDNAAWYHFTSGAPGTPLFFSK